MTAESFLDANILLYACSAAPQDTVKEPFSIIPMTERFHRKAAVGRDERMGEAVWGTGKSQETAV